MPILAGIVKLFDRVTDSASTRFAINHLVLRRYGKMTRLSIDPAKKTIDLELELEGETSAVQIHVGQYVFEKFEDGEATLKVSGVTVSRPWMQALVKSFVESKPHVIPAEMAGYLGMVL